MLLHSFQNSAWEGAAAAAGEKSGQATQTEATVSRHSKSEPKNENIVFD